MRNWGLAGQNLMTQLRTDTYMENRCASGEDKTPLHIAVMEENQCERVYELMELTVTPLYLSWDKFPSPPLKTAGMF